MIRLPIDQIQIPTGPAQVLQGQGWFGAPQPASPVVDQSPGKIARRLFGVNEFDGAKGATAYRRASARTHYGDPLERYLGDDAGIAQGSFQAYVIETARAEPCGGVKQKVPLVVTAFGIQVQAPAHRKKNTVLLCAFQERTIRPIAQVAEQGTHVLGCVQVRIFPRKRIQLVIKIADGIHSNFKYTQSF